MDAKPVEHGLLPTRPDSDLAFAAVHDLARDNRARLEIVEEAVASLFFMVERVKELQPPKATFLDKVDQRQTTACQHRLDALKQKRDDPSVKEAAEWLAEVQRGLGQLRGNSSRQSSTANCLEAEAELDGESPSGQAKFEVIGGKSTERLLCSNERLPGIRTEMVAELRRFQQTVKAALTHFNESLADQAALVNETSQATRHCEARNCQLSRHMAELARTVVSLQNNRDDNSTDGSAGSARESMPEQQQHQQQQQQQILTHASLLGVQQASTMSTRLH